MTSYAALRPRLVSGCAILWRDDSLISRAIRLWSDYSHASLVLRLAVPGLHERVFLVEALASGVELRLLSRRLADYTGEAWALAPPNLDATRQAAIARFALDVCADGCRYDYGSLLANMLGRVSMGARRYFCSEFVWAAWREAGIVQPEHDMAPRPGDLPRWSGLPPVRIH